MVENGEGSSIGRLHQELGASLAAAGIADSRLEAAILLGHLLGCGRAELIVRAGEPVSPERVRDLRGLLARRLTREPLAYILGEQEFWSLPFKVNRQVLIPRPETEELLERSLALVREEGGLPEGPALDLGVGSGAITVVLARELDRKKIVGVDRSLAALLLASENICRHQVEDRCLLVNSDWLDGFQLKPSFALVLSNPPYVADPVIEHLEPEVRGFEPRLALSGGQDGLQEIRRLAFALHPVMCPGAWFLMEIGADQEEAVMAIFSSYKQYGSLQVFPDLAGRPRIFQARRRYLDN